MTMKERLVCIEDAAKMMTLSQTRRHSEDEPLTCHRGDPTARADDLLVKAAQGLPIDDVLYDIIVALRESWGLPLA